VEIRVFYGDHHSKLLTGYSVDLSVGGVFLVTTYPFKVDDNVRLKLSFPEQEEKSVYCDARVAWINFEQTPLKPEYPAGVGLQITDLAPEDLQSIASFLELVAVW
jgi:uncharacterized protein (TIGR02266 family)